MHRQTLVARAVDEAKRGQCVQLADGLADRYLVAADDAPVGWDEGDNAAEVDVFRVPDSEIDLEITGRLGLAICKRKLKRWLEICVGLVRAG